MRQGGEGDLANWVLGGSRRDKRKIGELRGEVEWGSGDYWF